MARRTTESFSLSFLDVMSCGFGAIILLLIITKVSPPVALEDSETPSEGSVRELQQQLFAIRGETNILNRELNAKHEQLSEYQQKVARMRTELAALRGRLQDDTQGVATEDEQGKLAIARQALTDEMRRLQQSMSAQVDTSQIGGVPVDSEYIVFIIDTSGSMYNYSWNRMMEVVQETLRVYPTVKGIQV